MTDFNSFCSKKLVGEIRQWFEKQFIVVRKKFYGMIDEMRDAEDEFRITYELGYSNYTFELWMLLHVVT